MEGNIKEGGSKQMLIKYPKIYSIGHEENQNIFSNSEDEIVIEEKMDGANTRLLIHKGELYFGSRNREIDESSKDAKNFIRTVNFIKRVLDGKDLSFVEGHIIFLETMIKHTMSYDWDSIPVCLGFDIYTLKDNKFLNYKEKVRTFNKMGIPIVPLIKIVKAEKIKEINDKLVPDTKYPHPDAKDIQAEGIVFKNDKQNMRAKYVRDAFKEKASEAFGGTPKFGVGDDAKFVLKYCTNARIDKTIFKMIDEGAILEMKLMQFLPFTIYQDIFLENMSDILRSRQTLNLGKVNKLITKRCLSVLKQMITNRALINTDSEENKSI